MDVKLLLSKDSEVIENLFQYYIYDMSEYTKFKPNSDGTYTVDKSISKLDDYWILPDHFPYIVLADNEIAGFSLLRRFPSNKDCFDIGQFFILRKFKRLGIGEKAFELSVKNHPGKWITRVLLNNTGALLFWEKVISNISSDSPQVKKELYNNHEMLYYYYNIKP